MVLVVAALLAQDGGRFSDVVYASCPDASDAGPAVELDGGWWLPDPRGPRVACLVESCEMRREELEAQPASPAWVWLAVGLVVGVSVGVAVRR